MVYIIVMVVGFIGIGGMAHADLNNGLVSHYPFNGNSNDESTNMNHGTVYGATLAENRFGVTNSAYEFDGDDYIEVLDSQLLDITEKITISAWIKASTPSEAYSRVVSKCQSGVGNRQYNLALDETGSLARTVVDTETSPAIEIIGQNIIDNNWHNIVMTFDSVKAIKLYVDTNLQNSITVTSALVSRASNLVIGGITHTPQDQSFRGIIDDIRIYNRVLSESEIQELYNEGEETCDCPDSDSDGVPDAWDQCPDTPTGSCTNNQGCLCEGLYTEEQMNRMVSNILTWGDTNDDGKIGLAEAIQALRITSGVSQP